MTFARIDSGKKGEGLAVDFLKKQGFRIIARNYKTRLGEIDIIGRDKGCISFIEVRSLNSRIFEAPEYTIDRRKQGQISKAALSYIKRYGLEDKDSRFDVVCVEGVDSASPNIRLIKNAFDLEPHYRY
ncbi:MAG: YraN family protein [Candidatus Omnitrophica bacterium]|nr:YraN family protein [Candidatus Omnitrophota bacterium]MBU4589721.1 YraN family protein [Candidatus Omnitrophota bacterium]